MPSLTQVRARVETDLDDDTLNLIIGAEAEAIDRHAGGESASETQFASGLSLLYLRRKPAEISKITERRAVTSDSVTLANDDWRQVGSNGLRRLSDGTNQNSTWGAEVVIEYTPELDHRLRDRVLLDLVQMSVEFRAFDEEEVGDWKGKQKDFEKRRNALLAQIREGRSILL